MKALVVFLFIVLYFMVGVFVEAYLVAKTSHNSPKDRYDGFGLLVLLWPGYIA